MSSEIVAIGPHQSTELQKEEEGDYVNQILKVLQAIPFSAFVVRKERHSAEFTFGSITISISEYYDRYPLDFSLNDGLAWREIKVSWWQGRKIKKLARQIVDYINSKSENELLSTIVRRLKEA